MAFDLVQYFAEQINNQKPQLLEQHSREDRKEHLLEINALVLGKLITLWRSNDKKVYQEISSPEELFIQEVARHLTTSSKNQSTLAKNELEPAVTEILRLQLAELKQLNDIGNLEVRGLRELLLGQIEHLSGQAPDWVWSTNDLSELKGSKPIVQEEISLDSTMKEFNQMVSQQHTDANKDQHNTAAVVNTTVPGWSKILEPVVAIIILWVLYCAATQMFN
ncbi:hypothetical protein [Acinetobacter sp. ANC 4862]|uniref:hypothetical protein n=1 Tax=Acinetobacter sp. ANC 4862 TaxID=2529849 RepID=UPI00103B06AE|nr:hypothetical protein [Acinetobacter sp. ANC 4862]TCH63540.1 hypothetical protein E0409_09745 [Acinetobacter sp. ANC 4862]